MPFTTLVRAGELAEHLGEPEWLVVDCRAVLGDPAAGRALYEAGHIPGAVFADLDADLSGPVIPGRTGRHPLPDRPELVRTLRQLGIGNRSQVVAYDAGSGAMAAARLWWLLRWAGHAAAAVLDGGLAAWSDSGGSVESGRVERAPGGFRASFDDKLVVGGAEVEEALASGSLALVDSRAPDRFRGRNETIDPVAGHLPGAHNLPFAGNAGPGGTMLAPIRLRARFAPVLEGVPPERTAFYCGSGVTAALNVLAYTRAYGPMPRLYAGSWSEWIADRGRLRRWPPATGA